MTRFTCGSITVGIGVAMMLCACMTMCSWLPIASMDQMGELPSITPEGDESATTLTGVLTILVPCVTGMLTIGVGAGIGYWGASARVKEGYEILGRDLAAVVLLALGTLVLCACSPLFLISVIVPTASETPGESLMTTGILLLPLVLGGGAIIGGLIMLLFSIRRQARHPPLPRDTF